MFHLLLAQNIIICLYARPFAILGENEGFSGYNCYIKLSPFLFRDVPEGTIVLSSVGMKLWDDQEELQPV